MILNNGKTKKRVSKYNRLPLGEMVVVTKNGRYYGRKAGLAVSLNGKYYADIDLVDEKTKIYVPIENINFLKELKC